jgi:hypothetical protein
MYILQPRNIEQRQVVHITQDRPFALFDNDAVTPVVGAGIVTRLRAKRPGLGVRFLAGTDICPFTASRPTSGSTSFDLSPLSSNVRWPGALSCQIKSAWIYVFVPPYLFMAWCLIARSDTLALVVP